MPDREWFDWTEEEIERDKAKQAALFKRMIQRLETDGHCRYVFHRLAFVLFGDDMESASD